MNKSDLINAIACGAEINKATATKAWQAVEEFVGKTLASGEDLSLAGFGRFTRRRLAARTIKNPRTGELMQVLESLIPSFKPGKNLKEKLSLRSAEQLATEEVVS